MFIIDIKKELESKIDHNYRQTIQRFFKEKVNILGVRTAEVRKIAKKYFDLIKNEPKEKVWNRCEELLTQEYNEATIIAFDWAYRMRKQYEPSDFDIFERWLEKYVDNWGKCDDFSCKAFGDFILKYPEFITQIKGWTQSENRWVRRASAVIMIASIKKRNCLDDVFEIANFLLTDEDDMVQKGYGWLLKESSKEYQQEIFDYVMENKRKMPRTALRYAIEKMPKELKEKAMKKDW